MNWKRWIRPGAVLTLLVALAAVFLRHGALEEDIAARAASSLPPRVKPGRR